MSFFFVLSKKNNYQNLYVCETRQHSSNCQENCVFFIFLNGNKMMKEHKEEKKILFEFNKSKDKKESLDRNS